jgi:HAD superfamily hydrolase (TIGR01509 family)
MLVKGVILDLDGVILDSYRGGLRKIALLCASEDIPYGRQERQKLTELWGLPGIELLEHGLGIGREMAESLNQKWIRMDRADPPELVPGARSALAWMRRNCLTTCLLTSRWRVSADDVLSRLDITHSLQGACAREDVAHHKPDPRSLRPPLELLQGKFNIRPEECIFVGDTPSDIEAGHNAGIRTLVVQTGPYLLKHSDKEFGGKKIELADVLGSIDDLPFWLESQPETKLKELYR